MEKAYCMKIIKFNLLISLVTFSMQLGADTLQERLQTAYETAKQKGNEELAVFKEKYGVHPVELHGATFDKCDEECKLLADTAFSLMIKGSVLASMADVGTQDDIEKRWKEVDFSVRKNRRCIECMAEHNEYLSAEEKEAMLRQIDAMKNVMEEMRSEFPELMQQVDQ